MVTVTHGEFILSLLSLGYINIFFTLLCGGCLPQAISYWSYLNHKALQCEISRRFVFLYKYTGTHAQVSLCIYSLGRVRWNGKIWLSVLGFEWGVDGLEMREREREMFYLTMHSTHFIYGYMVSDIWLRTILIVRKETRCYHIGYSYRLTARVLLYAPSHRQDNTWSTGWNEK